MADFAVTWAQVLDHHQFYRLDFNRPHSDGNQRHRHLT